MSKVKKNKIKKVSRIFGIIFLISYLIFNYMLLSLDILPTKYLITYIIIMGLFGFLITSFLVLKKFKVGVKVLSFPIALISSLIFIVGSIYINKTYDFMGKIKSKNIIKESYYVVVNKDSNINSLDDLDKITVFNEKNKLYEKAIDKLKEKKKVKTIESLSVEDMSKDLINEEIDAILISGAHKEIIDNDLMGFKDLTKIIHTIEVETKIENEIQSSNINIRNEVFTVYLSGIDSYGDILARSRSDVNMLLTINPKTNEILLTSIPRDYYVQLYNTIGVKDKLTHAGFYGVEMSINTIESFMDIDIDYYLKVNFSTLVDIVDIIGGIEVYSDIAFYPNADPNLFIKQGVNYMNGAKALAFSRERYAYLEGDRHRVQNQQDVLKAIINKITSSSTLLTKYTTLLEQLSSSFETNINTKDITSLIKLQLEKMPSWQIKTYNLNGFDSSNITYTFGSQQLYVMEPDQETINIASSYIKGMKEGKTFEKLQIQ